jgi:hypothetical protein
MVNEDGWRPFRVVTVGRVVSETRYRFAGSSIEPNVNQ